MSESTGVLAGKVALITGGSSGIGKACAERFRAEDELPPLDVVHLNAGIITPGLAAMPGDIASALCPGFIDTPLVPKEHQPAIRERGAPIAPPSQVAEAAMQALAARRNGSLWTIWGDTIRQYEPPALELW